MITIIIVLLVLGALLSGVNSTEQDSHYHSLDEDNVFDPDID